MRHLARTAAQAVARQAWAVPSAVVATRRPPLPPPPLLRPASTGPVTPPHATDAEFGIIHRAAFAGDVATVQSVLREVPSAANAISSALRLSPLHIAAGRGHIELVLHLLRVPGVNVSLEDGDARLTPAHMAAQQGHVEVLEAFLTLGGVPATAVTSDGVTLLHAASRCRDAAAAVTCVRALLARGAAPNVLDATGSTPLHEACEAAAPETVRALLSAGAEVDLREDPKTSATAVVVEEAAASSSSAALAAAVAPGGRRSEGGASGGPVSAAAEAVDSDDVDDGLPRGTTALHVAAHNPASTAVECVEVLTEAGADVSLCDDLGQTPLHMALSVARELAYDVQGSEAEAEAAAASAASVGAPGGSASATAVTVDAVNSRAQAHVARIVRHLLRSGADPTAATLYARATPLHYAALAGWYEAVAALLAAGARADVRDEAGRTPIDVVEAQAAALSAAQRSDDPPPAIDVRVASAVWSALRGSMSRTGGVGEAATAGAVGGAVRGGSGTGLSR